MLLVCNGAQKSGSTWLYNILTSLVPCQIPDSQYLTGNSKNPCIRPGLLEQFLQSVDVTAENYISKNHLGEAAHRDLLLAHPDVYVFDIERDPRDVVVSLYYDARNRHAYKQSFSKYYWTQGREFVAELAAYHSLWRGAGPRSHITSYEGLKNDFAAEAGAIATLLGLSLTQADISQLHADTSMDRLRKKYSDQSLYEGDKFFRKGVVGDWENHFDSTALRDIEGIQKSGIGVFDRHHVAFRIKRWLTWQMKK